jgi:uncharacterized membrane protein YoaK (UPF0700 family)
MEAHEHREIVRPTLDRATSVNLLRAILGFSILSTGIHYTHNFVEVDQYPQSGIGISNSAIQVAVLVSWPLLTAIGLYAYRQYAAGRYDRANVPLLIYSLTGLVTLGHFLDGVPDIPPLFFATIFTDFLAGLAVAGFAIWSMRRGPDM